MSYAKMCESCRLMNGGRCECVDSQRAADEAAYMAWLMDARQMHRRPAEECWHAALAYARSTALHKAMEAEIEELREVDVLIQKTAHEVVRVETENDALRAQVERLQAKLSDADARCQRIAKAAASKVYRELCREYKEYNDVRMQNVGYAAALAAEKEASNA